MIYWIWIFLHVQQIIQSDVYSTCSCEFIVYGVFRHNLLQDDKKYTVETLPTPI